MNSPENKGKYLIMDMGAKGAMEFKERYKNAIFIYVTPPNLERLMSQMGTRGATRLQRSKRQIPNAVKVCDWLVVNDDLDVAVSEIQRIMHTIKEYGHNLNELDVSTLEFLFSKNFHNKKNVEFLQDFYGQESLHVLGS